jgi:hypothetical protein
MTVSPGPERRRPGARVLGLERGARSTRLGGAVPVGVEPAVWEEVVKPKAARVTPDERGTAALPALGEPERRVAAHRKVALRMAARRRVAAAGLTRAELPE